MCATGSVNGERIMSTERDAPRSFRPIRSDYVLSLPTTKGLPTIYLPELAFLGRSNVGKSSLINALCGRRELARTGNTPGKTRTLNLYEATFRSGEDDDKVELKISIVDLPGFGFAKVSKTTRDSWAELIDSYLTSRTNLEQVVLLIDGRREPGEEEQAIARAGGAAGVTVALTKADKLNRNELEAAKKTIASALNLPRERIFPVSVMDSKYSVDKLRDNLLQRALGADE